MAVVSSSFPNKGVGAGRGGVEVPGQNAAALELPVQRAQCRFPGRMGTQEVFLEFCLSPALGVLLRKSRQLVGIWPPAQLSGLSYREGRCLLCPTVGHYGLSLTVVGNRYRQGQRAWEVAVWRNVMFDVRGGNQRGFPHLCCFHITILSHQCH